MNVLLPVALDVHGGHLASRRAGLETRHVGVRQQRDHMRVRLRLHQARKAVTGVTADALGFVRVLLVEHDAEWNVEWLQSEAGKVVSELLDARLMRDRRMRIGRARPGVGGILATRAVHMIEILSRHVVRFQVVIANWPGGRYAP